MISEANEIPIVCNPQVFSKAELSEHVALAMDVIFRLPQSKTELPDGFVFEYRGNEELFLKVARFVHNEHRCCSWVSFGIEMEPFATGSDGVIRLRYLGGPEGKVFLAEAIEKLAAAASDPRAHERLQQAIGDGNTITPDNKASFYEKVIGGSPGLLGKLKSACGC